MKYPITSNMELFAVPASKVQQIQNALRMMSSTQEAAERTK
jgi:hypothetical protein